MNFSIKVLFYMGAHSSVLCHEYTLYIAHMETELESHSFQHWTLGSYVIPGRN